MSTICQWGSVKMSDYFIYKWEMLDQTRWFYSFFTLILLEAEILGVWSVCISYQFTTDRFWNFWLKSCLCTFTSCNFHFVYRNLSCVKYSKIILEHIYLYFDQRRKGWPAIIFSLKALLLLLLLFSNIYTG